MRDEPLAATINLLMDFLKIHTDERDVSWVYGKMRKLLNKTIWTIDDEKQAQEIIKRALEKTEKIKIRRSFYNNRKE